MSTNITADRRSTDGFTKIARIPSNVKLNKGRLPDGLYQTIWDNFEKERERTNPYRRTVRKPRKLYTTKRKNILMFNRENEAGEALLMCTPNAILLAERKKLGIVG